MCYERLLTSIGRDKDFLKRNHRYSLRVVHYGNDNIKFFHTFLKSVLGPIIACRRKKDCKAAIENAVSVSRGKARAVYVQ